MAMISESILFFRDGLDKIASRTYHTSTLGLGRSLLAFGLIITLIANRPSTLWAEHLFSARKDMLGLYKYNFFHLFGFENLLFAQIIAVILLIVVIIGYLPQVTCFIQWYLSFSFFTSASIIEGGDQIASILSLYLIPLCICDSRINHWYEKPTPNRNVINFFSACVFLVISLQMSGLYLQAAIEKPYKVMEWLDGTALYYWINHDTFGADEWLLYFINPIIDSPFWLSTLSWGSIIFELIMAGALLISSEKKKNLFALALAFHFSILLVHGLVSFFFAMAGGLTLYLLKGRKIRGTNFFTRFNRRSNE